MGDLLIRNLDEKLAHQIAARASRAGRTSCEEAEDLLRKGLQLTEPDADPPAQTAFDAIRSIFVEEGALDEEFSGIMDEVEAERKRSSAGHPKTSSDRARHQYRLGVLPAEDECQCPSLV
ncbi:plasmid stabilization protein [Rhizobium straminoryzae]|uniref:plasmid stabilization protein n=1 Tax=Rhizobium straminoryzae TaxID=1387186 RepID=UPI00163DAD03|nr:plasmid stabilization protein [Rhizobium straminoryzae]